MVAGQVACVRSVARHSLHPLWDVNALHKKEDVIRPFHDTVCLVPLARRTTAVAMLDDDTYLSSDNSYNLMTLRKNGDAATDEDRNRLEVRFEFLPQFHIRCTCWAVTSVQPVQTPRYTFSSDLDWHDLI